MSAASSLRAIVAQSVLSSYGVSAAAPTLRWPSAEPGDVLDYSVDMAPLISDVSDVIASASVAVMPSGNGEVQINSVVVTGSVVTAWITGGVSGRTYIVRVSITTAAGRTFQSVVSIGIDAALATYPLPAPSSQGFGTPATWALAPGLDLSSPLNSLFVTL